MAFLIQHVQYGEGIYRCNVHAIRWNWLIFIGRGKDAGPDALEKLFVHSHSQVWVFAGPRRAIWQTGLWSSCCAQKKHGRGKELLAKLGNGVLTRRANECGGVFEVDDEMLLNLSCWSCGSGQDIRHTTCWGMGQEIHRIMTWWWRGLRQRIYLIQRFEVDSGLASLKRMQRWFCAS